MNVYCIVIDSNYKHCIINWYWHLTFEIDTDTLPFDRFVCVMILQVVRRLWKSSTRSQWNNWLAWSFDIFCWRSKTACEGAAARLVTFVDWLSVWRCPRTLCCHFIRLAGMYFRQWLNWNIDYSSLFEKCLVFLIFGLHCVVVVICLKAMLQANNGFT